MRKTFSLIVILILCGVSFYLYTFYKNNTPTEDISMKQCYELAQRPDTIILDVRTRQEFQEGHIANAMLLDVDDLSFEDSLALLDKEAPYLVYCRSGQRSLKALEIMKQQGFKHVYHLGEGILGWQQAGYPIE